MWSSFDSDNRKLPSSSINDEFSMSTSCTEKSLPFKASVFELSFKILELSSSNKLSPASDVPSELSSRIVLPVKSSKKISSFS